MAGGMISAIGVGRSAGTNSAIVKMEASYSARNGRRKLQTSGLASRGVDVGSPDPARLPLAAELEQRGRLRIVDEDEVVVRVEAGRVGRARWPDSAPCPRRSGSRLAPCRPLWIALVTWKKGSLPLMMRQSATSP